MFAATADVRRSSCKYDYTVYVLVCVEYLVSLVSLCRLVRDQNDVASPDHPALDIRHQKLRSILKSKLVFFVILRGASKLSQT